MKEKPKGEKMGEKREGERLVGLESEDVMLAVQQIKGTNRKEWRSFYDKGGRKKLANFESKRRRVLLLRKGWSRWDEHSLKNKRKTILLGGEVRERKTKKKRKAVQEQHKWRKSLVVWGSASIQEGRWRDNPRAGTAERATEEIPKGGKGRCGGETQLCLWKMGKKRRL